MRSPVGIALLFSLLLLGWLFSRPIQELLAGHEPPATPAPVASNGPLARAFPLAPVHALPQPDKSRKEGDPKGRAIAP